MELSEVVHLMFCASGVLPATISIMTGTNAGSCGCCACEKPHTDMQNSFAWYLESTVGMMLQIFNNVEQKTMHFMATQRLKLKKEPDFYFCKMACEKYLLKQKLLSQC